MWKLTEFMRATTSGPMRDAGYGYKGLALYQAMPGSPKGRRPPRWYLIHLNTGHSVAVIDGTVAKAFPVATEIAELGDWDFDGLTGWKNRDPELGKKIVEVIARHKNAMLKTGRNVGSDPEQAKNIAITRMK